MSDLNIELCYMSATEAIAAFKRMHFSPVGAEGLAQSRTRILIDRRSRAKGTASP